MRTRASHRSLIVVASVLLGSVSAAPALAQTPVAFNDSYTTNEDSTLNVGGSGVRSNDNLAGFGNNADAIVLAGPSHGTLTLGQNGNFTYVPSANFNGTDTFTYRLRYPTNQLQQRGDGNHRRQPRERRSHRRRQSFVYDRRRRAAVDPSARCVGGRYRS